MTVPRAPAESGRAFARAILNPRHAFSLLLLVAGGEATALLMRAAGKPFGYDELLTLHVSSLHASGLWQALQAGVDGMPPGFYEMVVAARMLPGDPHVILRLPSIIGYVLAIFGIYWFTTKRFPPAAGLIAVLLLTLSPFRSYALEARSYALLVGLLAMSAALWQRIEAKLWITVLFALCLALAISCHYYAVVALLIFGIAELVTSLFSRGIRWTVWTAILFATTPFILSLPLLLRFREMFGKYFWSRATWAEAVLPHYERFFGLDQVFSLVFVSLWGIVAAGLLLRLWRTPQATWPTSGFRPPEILLIAGFLIYPSLLAALTLIQGAGYTDRYSSPVILGLVLATVSLFRGARAKSGSAYLLAALLLVCVIQGSKDIKSFASRKSRISTPDPGWSTLAELSQNDPGLPVVIANGLIYLQMAHYAAPDLRGRLVEIVDREGAIRLAGTDSVDNANRQLRQFISLRVEDAAPFLAGHDRFIVYSDQSRFSWLPKYLLAKGYELKLLSGDTGSSIYIVEKHSDSR